MYSGIIRTGFVVAGIALLVFGFWAHAIKKLAVNYAVIWGLLGIVLTLVGAVPIFSAWTTKLGSGTGVALFCVGALVLFTEVQESIVISQLNLKNRELAMQVAMLNQENEAIKAEVERLAGAQEKANAEENLICH